MVSLIDQFSGVLTVLISACVGGLSTWLITTYKYNREKKQRKAHLKAKKLDEILNQCRILERLLNNYRHQLNLYKKYLDAEELDPETGYPKNAFDFETMQNYGEYISSLKEAKEILRHKHQNYVIKTKSDEISELNIIDESLTKLIKYKESPDFDYKAAIIEYLEVFTNLRMVHHQIKEVYPEEVSID